MIGTINMIDTILLIVIILIFISVHFFISKALKILEENNNILKSIEKMLRKKTKENNVLDP